MAKRGLRTSRGGPIVRSKLAHMLKNPIYIGLVNWGGVVQQGSHEPLISNELFDRVQRTFQTRDLAGPRERKHSHQFKGLIYCGVCNSRLCLTVSKGRNGYFSYFFCIGRSQRRTDCQEAYLPAADLDRALDALYQKIRFTPHHQQMIRDLMSSEIALQVVGDEKTAKHQAVQLVRLEHEREKLMQAYYKEAISIDLLKKEQARIEGEIAAIQERINVNVAKLEDARTLIEHAMRILRSCYETYKAADEATRQRLNQMLFSRIVVGGRQIKGVDFAEPFRTVFRWVGSNKDLLVARMGFEPTTSPLKGN